MQVQSVNSYNFSYNKTSFEGGIKNPISLKYILSKHRTLLPERVQEEARKVLRTNPQNTPTLKRLHQNTYAQLMECGTLEEAKRLFPEFNGVQNATEVFSKARGNIKTLIANGQLNENLSLKLLKDFWGELKTHEEIAKEMGLTNRNAVNYIFTKLGIPPFSQNYKTLILSSEPETRAVMAAKTTAWNAMHPDLMRAHNKMAAQGNKVQWRREASSVRMKEYDIEHPERRQKISEFFKEVWARLPEVREELRKFISEQDTSFTRIISKEISGEKLTDTENRMKRILYKKFWESHPECHEQYRQACKEVSILRK